MKEFDKWWEEEDPMLGDCEGYAKGGWKAALDWVAKRGMHHYGNDFLTDMSELSTEIQIELGMLDERGKVVR